MEAQEDISMKESEDPVPGQMDGLTKTDTDASLEASGSWGWDGRA